jgi:membrane peptidoglycan carboxypeptidase
MAAAYATFPAMGIYAKPMAIRKVILPGNHEDKDSGWGKPQSKRALSQGVAWKVTDVLRQNAEYGTGAGSGDGIHPNAGKTGTTENHADAWFDGYTRELSTVVWMGYPKGEIPMLSVHGVAVAGATFPVPIWHAYMAAALWNRPVHAFALPDKYPAWRSITRGDYGSFGYVYTPPAYTTPATTTAETTTGAQKGTAPKGPAPKATPPKHKDTPKKQAPPPPPPTTVAPPPTTPEPPPTTTEPPPSPGQTP